MSYERGNPVGARNLRRDGASGGVHDGQDPVLFELLDDRLVRCVRPLAPLVLRVLMIAGEASALRVSMLQCTGGPFHFSGIDLGLGLQFRIVLAPLVLRVLMFAGEG